MKKILIILFFIIPLNVNAVSTSATSSILMDMDSGRILYANNIHNIRSIASISKIMTAIVVLENTSINDSVLIGEEIKDAYGSAIYIKKGEVMTVKDLLYGLLLRSGNDAALSLASYSLGSIEGFVSKMNEKAKELKMKNSVFNNPSGLDEKIGNYSTAYDMALLTSYAMKNNDYKNIVKTKNYKLKTNMNVYSWNNKNKLLNIYKYTTGGKTGYTEKAKRTLVTTASKDSLNLVAVTLNDGNDFSDHVDLFEYGFKSYINYQILRKGSVEIIGEDYYKGYKFYINNDFRYPLTKVELETLVVKYELKKLRTIKNNSKVGKVIIYLGDNCIFKDDIFIKKIETKKSFFEKIWTWITSVW